MFLLTTYICIYRFTCIEVTFRWDCFLNGTRKRKSVQVQTSILTDLHTSDLTHAQESPVP